MLVLVREWFGQKVGLVLGEKWCQFWVIVGTILGAVCCGKSVGLGKDLVS